MITFSLSSLGNMRTLEAIALHAARQDFAITLIPVTAPTQAGIQGAFSRIGELAVDAVIAIMEVHLLDAATVTLPPGVKVVAVDSDAGLRLADEPGCTAVFAANDHMALGLLRAFREKGKSVPEDISLVGFDDVPEASSYTPPLTTVYQNFTDVGNRCVDNVLQQIRTNNTTQPGVALVATELVIRQSTSVGPRQSTSQQQL